jgi:plastocyanin/uncharacterized protein (DUF2141 family)
MFDCREQILVLCIVRLMKKCMKKIVLQFMIVVLLSLFHETGQAATITIRMSSFAFTPAITNIGVGDTVIWTNTANAGLGSTHTSNSGDPTCTTNSFWGSGDVLSHTTYSHTFTNIAPGTYTYLCTFHCATFNMKGTLIITNVAAPNSPPSVAITNPPNGTVFTAPANVAIQADASDTAGGGVTNVQFLVGSTVLTDDTTAPYSATTNGLPAGNYTLTAIATDNDGAKATNSVGIVVNAPPSVSITNPPPGATFVEPANVTIQADASDTGGGSVTNVQFLVGSTVLANDTTSPYAATTNALPAGNYTLSAIASDNNGAQATNSIHITVNPNQPPTVSITNPAGGAAFRVNSNVTVQVSASDTDGSVASVELNANGGAIGSSAGPNFNFAIAFSNAGNYTLTARATDNLGLMKTSAPVNIFVLTNAILTSPQWSNGQFQFKIIGIAGQTYISEASASFSNWAAFATNVAPANTFDVLDPGSSNFILRFYRVRQDF